MKKPKLITSYLIGIGIVVGMFLAYLGLSYLPSSTFKGIILLLWLAICGGVFLGNGIYLIRKLKTFDGEEAGE